MERMAQTGKRWKVLAAALVAFACAWLVAAAPAMADDAYAANGIREGQTFTKDGNTYRVTDYDYDDYDDAGEVMLVKYGSSSKKAVVNTVTYKGKKFEVEAIGRNAFNNAKGHKITALTIGRNVDKVLAKAFYGCSKLKTIDMRKADLVDIDRDRGGYYLDDVDIASNAFSKAGVKNVKVRCGVKNAEYRKLFKQALRDAGMRKSVTVSK